MATRLSEPCIQDRAVDILHYVVCGSVNVHFTSSRSSLAYDDGRDVINLLDGRRYTVSAIDHIDNHFRAIVSRTSRADRIATVANSRVSNLSDSGLRRVGN